ncbi:twin-arginine translocase TatA/TatE family subunit [Acidocella sp.]|uniref:twin-arginine translocase TatA/TatE family subunit n=1 Tax=Acidocella sp. TaxID=50710 RepID=UPI00260EE2F0|nr:twin-arginine translocase TatA/TatE family subunit [Acidocella sp.]
MGGLSIWHWLVVLAVITIVFGAGRIGNVMGEFGKGIKNFKQAMNEDEPKKTADASMSTPGTLGGPAAPTMPEPQKTTANQG